jgi:hypothetical protein
MAKKTYRGSCFCGRVTFQANIDISAGTGKCNCTSCWKRRWWSASVPQAEFEATGGEDLLQFNPLGHADGRGWFCRHCGVIPFIRIDAQPWNDGPYVQVNVAALDDLDPTELLAAPVKYADGRNDNWWNPPPEVRHL